MQASPTPSVAEQFWMYNQYIAQLCRNSTLSTELDSMPIEPIISDVNSDTDSNTDSDPLSSLIEKSFVEIIFDPKYFKIMMDFPTKKRSVYYNKISLCENKLSVQDSGLLDFLHRANIQDIRFETMARYYVHLLFCSCRDGKFVVVHEPSPNPYTDESAVPTYRVDVHFDTSNLIKVGIKIVTIKHVANSRKYNNTVGKVELEYVSQTGKYLGEEDMPLFVLYEMPTIIYSKTMIPIGIFKLGNTLYMISLKRTLTKWFFVEKDRQKLTGYATNYC